MDKRPHIKPYLYAMLAGFGAISLSILLFFLIYVGKHPGTTPSDLTEALHLDWGHSQRCITKLVENGFLTKEKAGRRYQLDLTEKGREAFAISHQVFFDWDEKRLAVLTEEERQTLFALLRKLTPGREVPRHV